MRLALFLGGLCLGLPLLAAGDPAADTRTTLSLEAAWSRTLQANPQLQIVESELEAAAAGRQQAALPAYNPELSWEQENPRGTAASQTWRLAQALELGGQRGARVQVAEARQQLSAAAAQDRRQALQAEVYAAFMDVLAAQEAERLAQGSLALAEKAGDMARRRVTAGKVAPLEATKAAVAQASAEVELAQAQTRLANTRQVLASYWAGKAGALPALSGELETLPAMPETAALQNRLAQSPARLQGGALLRQREAELTLEQRNALPAITLSGGIKRSEAREEDATLLGVSLPLPLFNRNQGKRREAQARIEQARSENTALESSQNTQLHTGLQRLDAARTQLAALRNKILPGAEQALLTASTGYELGKFGFLEVLDAERTLFVARHQYLAALTEAHRAYADIGRLVGFDTLR